MSRPTRSSRRRASAIGLALLIFGLLERQVRRAPHALDQSKIDGGYAGRLILQTLARG